MPDRHTPISPQLRIFRPESRQSASYSRRTHSRHTGRNGDTIDGGVAGTALILSVHRPGRPITSAPTSPRQILLVSSETQPD